MPDTPDNPTMFNSAILHATFWHTRVLSFSRAPSLSLSLSLTQGNQNPLCPVAGHPPSSKNSTSAATLLPLPGECAT
jgi:hypothetical protein